MRSVIYLEGTFHSKWFSKFINHWFFFGASFQTEKLLYLVFFIIKTKFNCCPIFFFFESLEKIKPSIGLKFFKKKKKKKIKVTAVPFVLPLAAQYQKAVLWLAKSIRVRHEQKLVSKIVNELYSVNFLGVGESLKKKTEYYKFAVVFKTTKRFKWG
jgi:ribosomal protein S7